MNTNNIKNILGSKFSDYKVVAFIRHPYGRLVSSYFFYKRGAKYWAWKGREQKKPLEQRIKIKIAQILPFYIWAIIYPYKSNIEYFFDINGALLIDKNYTGVFENLNEDLKSIFLKIGVDITEIPHENKTSHKEEEKYFKNTFFRSLINMKVKKDLLFYNSILANKNSLE